MEKKRLAEKQSQQKLRKHHGHQRHRMEIWVRNDGTSCQDQVDDNYDEDLSKLDAVVVNFVYEPPRGKTNNVVFEQVQHKPGRTSTEKS